MDRNTEFPSRIRSISNIDRFSLSSWATMRFLNVFSKALETKPEHRLIVHRAALLRWLTAGLAFRHVPFAHAFARWPQVQVAIIARSVG
jgi:hypothetical protein